jgi:hypothetical protein
VPLGSCVLRPLTGRCRVNFRRPAQCPLGSYVFRKRRARPSLFRLPFCSRRCYSARRSPFRRSPLHRSPSRARPGLLLAGPPRRLPAARPPCARPSRSPPPPGLHRRRRPGPCAHLLLGRPATAGCSGAPPQPSARPPRHRRPSLNRFVASGNYFRVFVFIFLLNILTSESQLILNRRKLCQLG